MPSRRAVLAGLVAVLGAVGCTGSTDFDITKTFDPVTSAGSPAAYSSPQHVDLASEAGSAWKHRSKIKSLELVGLTGTMTANHTGVATTGTGSVVLSRGTSIATVGSWTDESIPATPPHTISATLNPAAVAIVEDALRSDGLFDVTFAGTTGDPVSFGAEVTRHLKLKYKVP